MRRATGAVVAAGALAVLVAGCGGDKQAGVASLGSTTSTTQAPSPPDAGNGGNTNARYQAALAYVNCMRSHGVPNFPDPTRNGTLNVNFQRVEREARPSQAESTGTPRSTSRPTRTAGTSPGRCADPAQNQLALVKGLKFAQCMRSHGVPNFPDPTAANVVHLGAGVDPGSPQFQNAQKICQNLVPGAGTK